VRARLNGRHDVSKLGNTSGRLHCEFRAPAQQALAPAAAILARDADDGVGHAGSDAVQAQELTGQAARPVNADGSGFEAPANVLPASSARRRSRRQGVAQRRAPRPRRG